MLELADTLAKLTGGPGDHGFEAERAGDVRSSTADVARADRELGWRAACSLEEGLGATVDWYRAQLGLRDEHPAG